MVATAPQEAGAIHRVEVVTTEPAPTAPGLAVLITMRGPRVEGLDVESAARLLALLR